MTREKEDKIPKPNGKLKKPVISSVVLAKQHWKNACRNIGASRIEIEKAKYLKS